MSNHPRRGHRHHPITKAAGASGTILTLGAALVAVSPGTAGAATIVVNSAADDGGGGATTLREAIEQANSTAAVDDVITFDAALNGQTITLDGSQLEITDALNIQGPGADLLTIDADDGSRVFYIQDSDNDVTIAGLTIMGGNTGSSGGAIYSGTLGALTLTGLHVTESYAEFAGGGIYASGASSVTITGTTFDDNSANRFGGGARIHDVDGATNITDSTFDHNYAGDYGGGLSLYGNAGTTNISGSTFSTNYSSYAGGIEIYDNGTVNITDSTIANNHVDESGGGIQAHATGDVNITRSTISGNEASVDGGGVYAYNADTITITNSTISGNEAGSDGGGLKFASDEAGSLELVLTHSTVTLNTADEDEGGGLRLAQHATIDHTIIAGNTGGDAVGDDGADADLSNSLIGDAKADLTGITVTEGPNNVFSTDPMLGPLANNGGPTQTHALLAGSPALNSGDPAFTPPPTTDQRGEPRVADVVIDKGAYEAQVDEEPRGEEPPAAQPVGQAPSFTG
jgi:CSLREA domain-containing protein